MKKKIDNFQINDQKTNDYYPNEMALGFGNIAGRDFLKRESALSEQEYNYYLTISKSE